VLNISSYIDHTLLKPTSTLADIRKLCEEATQYHFTAVCIPPCWVKQASESVSGTDVKVATVVGFPLGYEVLKAKCTETEQAILDGADELDTVINLSALKSGSWSYLQKEMEQIAALVHGSNKMIKVIIETGLLSDDEIVQCCQLYGDMGVDFLKTSTGYAEKGASVNAINLMRRNLPAAVKIKASGGIRTYDFAKQLIDAGASRIGSSAGVTIVQTGMAQTIH
jgi:deoxyribose-phosphate aldolase